MKISFSLFKYAGWLKIRLVSSPRIMGFKRVGAEVTQCIHECKKTLAYSSDVLLSVYSKVSEHYKSVNWQDNYVVKKMHFL